MGLTSCPAPSTSTGVCLPLLSLCLAFPASRKLDLPELGQIVSRAFSAGPGDTLCSSSSSRRVGVHLLTVSMAVWVLENSQN